MLAAIVGGALPRAAVGPARGGVRPKGFPAIVVARGRVRQHGVAGDGDGSHARARHGPPLMRCVGFSGQSRASGKGYLSRGVD